VLVIVVPSHRPFVKLIAAARCVSADRTVQIAVGIEVLVIQRGPPRVTDTALIAERPDMVATPGIGCKLPTAVYKVVVLIVVAGWAEAGKVTLTGVELWDVLELEHEDNLVVMSADQKVGEAADAFNSAVREGRPRLYAIVITESGDSTDGAVGIVTQMRAVSVAEWKHQSVALSSSGAYTRRILLGDGLQELFEHIRRVMTVPDTMAHGPYDVTFTCS
jgi:hypothetical protein